MHIWVWCCPRCAIWLLGAVLVVLFHVAAWRYLAAEDLENVDISILNGQTIVIDAGHGGVDGGCTGHGLREKDITLAVALKLAAMLRQAGANVVLTRTCDCDYYSLGGGKRGDLLHRAALINQSGAAVFISIHANAMRDSRWFGAQVFYNPQQQENRQLAEAVQQALRDFPPGNKRRVKQDSDILLLKKTNIPGVLAEIGFLSNPREAALLADGQYQERIAAALLRALAYHFHHGVAR